MHLKTQLVLNNAILQTKDATIEALQISNYQLKQIIGNKEIKPEKEESVAGGLMSIKNYEGKGFSINLPELYRRLRRRMKK